MTVPAGPADVDPDQASVDLYWLPLGAGQSSWCVQGSGRLYEAFTAARHHRARLRLYHSALIVRVDGHAHAIEMAPVWAVGGQGRGVVVRRAGGVAVMGSLSTVPLRGSLLA